MRYHLVGHVGVETLAPGQATLIRQRRTFLGCRRWSYLYFDEDCKETFWGPWQNHNMVEAGGYPATKEISEAVAFYLIDEYMKTVPGMRLVYKSVGEL